MIRAATVLADENGFRPQAILLVRLGALGDIVHALPVAAALRRCFPHAQIDWVVDERYRALVDLVPVVDRRIVLRTKSAWLGARMTDLRRQLMDVHYDVAVDVQGLLKSAVVARLSGARHVLGFTRPYLREPAARFFYTDAHDPGQTTHVIYKNLSLVRALGAEAESAEFPLKVTDSSVLATLRGRDRELGAAPFVVLNPGAAWPNKRWPPARFGAVAQWLLRERGLGSVVTWGPGDEDLAAAVVSGSAGAATLAPATTIGGLASIVEAACLLVSGDTGPAHLAAALGTPIVGLYGPTDVGRNGPWSPEDVTVSRFDVCHCHYRRRCRASRWCLEHITSDDVIAAVARRLDGSI